ASGIKGSTGDWAIRRHRTQIVLSRRNPKNPVFSAIICLRRPSLLKGLFSVGIVTASKKRDLDVNKRLTSRSGDPPTNGSPRCQPKDGASRHLIRSQVDRCRHATLHTGTGVVFLLRIPFRRCSQQIVARLQISKRK